MTAKERRIAYLKNSVAEQCNQTSDDLALLFEVIDQKQTTIADRNIKLAHAQAEIARLNEIVRAGIEESVGKAPCSFVDGGIQVEHWAIRAMVASFARSVGDAVNYIEVTVHDAEGQAFVVNVRKGNGKTDHQCRREAEAEIARLRELLEEQGVASAVRQAGAELSMTEGD